MPRADGRTLHMGLTDGELARRIVVVGHHSRAELLASFLEPEEADGKVFKLESDRGFVTYTGRFEGVRFSVVSCGMGMAMVDFFVRESRAVTQGPMAISRFGTCGCLKDACGVGGVGVATGGSVYVRRNYDAFGEGAAGDAYDISRVCPSDAALSAAVVECIGQALGPDAAVTGTNATADSFYSSQGRIDPAFNDRNEDLIAEAQRRHPDLISMEMETYGLLHLARCALPAGSIRATAASILVANRGTGQVVDGDKLKATERDAGHAIMRAVAAADLGPDFVDRASAKRQKQES